MHRRWLQGQQDSGQQEAGSLVWVQYQRFAKRTEGVRASRQVRHNSLPIHFRSLNQHSGAPVQHVHRPCSGSVFRLCASND
jgi:hypothetical protein